MKTVNKTLAPSSRTQLTKNYKNAVALRDKAKDNLATAQKSLAQAEALVLTFMKLLFPKKKTR